MKSRRKEDVKGACQQFEYFDATGGIVTASSSWMCLKLSVEPDHICTSEATSDHDCVLEERVDVHCPSSLILSTDREPKMREAGL